MFKKDARFIRAVASLVGTTVGAGMFALPYILSRSGLLVFSILIVGVGLLSTRLNQLYAQAVVKTQGDRQLPGYAEIYLGKWGKLLALFSLVFGIYGALVVYIVQGGVFLSSFLPLDPVILGLLFWLVFSALLVSGLRITSMGEVVLSGGIFALVLFIVGRASLHFDFLNLPILGQSNLPTLVSSLGVVLFAFGGVSAIPEVEEIMRAERGKLPRVISLSGNLVLILYIFFALAVVGACGGMTTPLPFSGLRDVLGSGIFLWGTVLGLMALGSSYLFLGYSLREVYFRDFGIPKPLAWFLVLVPPVLIALFSNLGFLSVLGVTGMIGIGLSWVLVLLIYFRSFSSAP